jgi:hypothetical protein
MNASQHDSSQPLDPVYVHSRREATVIVSLIGLFCVWSVTVCYWFGYVSPEGPIEPVSTIWGMPAWVFWGILLPWLVVDAVAVWFCFFFMEDDDLGENQPEGGDGESEGAAGSGKEGRDA